MVVLDGIKDRGQAGLHDGNHFGPRTLMTPSTRPSPVRILSALERQPGAWIRTGPRSIEHAGLRVRLTLGIVSVRIASSPTPTRCRSRQHRPHATVLPGCWRIGCAVRPARTWIPTTLRGAPARRRRPGNPRVPWELRKATYGWS